MKDPYVYTATDDVKAGAFAEMGRGEKGNWCSPLPPEWHPLTWPAYRNVRNAKAAADIKRGDQVGWVNASDVAPVKAPS